MPVVILCRARYMGFEGITNLRNLLNMEHVPARLERVPVELEVTLVELKGTPVKLESMPV